MKTNSHPEFDFIVIGGGGLPFAERKRRIRINSAAQAGNDTDFFKRIRIGTIPTDN